jgi:hypothetical protein
MGQIGQHRLAIRHDGDTVVAHTTAIAAAQNGRTLAAIDEHPSQGRHQWRFAAASDAQIADADHRTTQAPAGFGMAFVPVPAGRDSLRVKKVKQWV